MKNFFKFIPVLVAAFFIMSCNHGSDAINKAYELACQKASAVDVANTLINGDVRSITLDSDNGAKLGAVLAYIEFNGEYNSDFFQKVDKSKFDWLVNDYNAMARRQDGTDRIKMQELIKKYEEACCPVTPEEVIPCCPDAIQE